MTCGKAKAGQWRVGLLGLMGLWACASMEPGEYGVNALLFEQAEQVNTRALKSCLLTRERQPATLTLGREEYVCNEPPFDASEARVVLWTWPWTEWPSFNVAVFEKDLKRVMRWYRARGFYGAHIVEVRIDPPHAAHPDAELPPAACDPERDECEVSITVVVDEGRPVQVASVRVEGAEGLPAEARQQLAQARLPAVGDRFDEADHDAAKRSLAEQLAEVSHADADVSGSFEVDRQRRAAHLTYRVAPGPSYRFGQVRVQGHGSLPTGPIMDAADIEAGAPYRRSALAEAEREIYALEAFSMVTVTRELVPELRIAHVNVNVVPLKPHVFRLGLGVMSGVMQRGASDALKDVPQWDAHVFARYEMRQLFGGLGRLRLEDRPRIIMNKSFPQIPCCPPSECCEPSEDCPRCPTFGNILELGIRQPAFLEPRIILAPSARWDWGPDPFLDFMRSDVLVRLGLERPLYRRLLLGAVGLQQEFFVVAEGEETSDGSELPANYGFRFIEEDLRLDWRDDVVQPTRGLYLRLLGSQAVKGPASSWTLFRISPELRGYVPLPFGMVVASRFEIAALFITSADEHLDRLSRELGPQAHRLRGGGATSNRGFLPGELGDGLHGGLRRWEGSLELRLRLGGDFSLVFFGDMGDVHRGLTYRFDHLNTSVGFGLRYLTLVGPIRLDIGFRIPALQRLDGSDGIEDDANELPLIKSPGALHLTIGEAF